MNLWRRLKNLWKLSEYPHEYTTKEKIDWSQVDNTEPRRLARVVEMQKPLKELLEEDL